VSPAARVLLPYVRREWKALAGAGGATAVQTAADLAKPWPLAIVVDHVLGRTAPFALESADWRLLIGVAVLVLVIALAEAAALYLSNLWLQTAGERISHELRIAVYDHLQRLSLAFHQKRQKGDLLTRVTGDVNAMGDLFAQSLGTIAQAALLAAGMTVVLLVIDPVLALVSLATTPALLGISWVYRRRVRTTAKVRRAHEGRIASMAGEALSAMAVEARLEARDRDRVRPRRRRHARRLRGALPRRAARLRQLHAQGLQPAQEPRAREHEGGGDDGQGRPGRRDPLRRRRPRGRHLPRRARGRRRRARARGVRVRPRAAGAARRLAADRGRHQRRARRPVGSRQVDARGARRALPRSHRGPTS
jgi:ABC-type multidrug transport system fused ATPase/permease subunit